MHVERAYVITLLPCYSVTLLPCYSVTLLPCYFVTLLPCYLVTLLPCYLDTLLLCYLDALLPSKYHEHQHTKRCLGGRLEGFKVSLWFLKRMKLVKCRIAKKCPDFHHCFRWLHHHYSRGCHMRFYLNETVLNSEDLIQKC